MRPGQSGGIEASLTSTVMLERRVITFEGIVQGVGLRPYAFGLARALELAGVIRNDASGLTLDLEGPPRALDDLTERLIATPPPLAKIDRVAASRRVPVRYASLTIAPSVGSAEGPSAIQLTPDAATCERCRAELLDPDDRRYRHPFISCTDCGPRLTITTAAPWDRERTTMARFPMCESCRVEYIDPASRRYHAQTIACWDCGPTLHWLAVPSGSNKTLAGDAAMMSAVAAIASGGLVAVKGLGGYHLACDASSTAAVRRLRAAKRRADKPFALMVADVATAGRIADVGAVERELLGSASRPIVLSGRTRHPAYGVDWDGVAPGTREVGLMLPYTPVHHLLLHELGRPVVMTSGNLSDEPIVADDNEAELRLGPIVDGLLINDRPIATRCDDSVIRVRGSRTLPIRRSRGFAPRSIAVATSTRDTILAVGGHLKNTFCLLNGNRAFVSHHVGDLEDYSAQRALSGSIAHYMSVLRLRPVAIAHDDHPGYASTQLARAFDGLPLVSVQHHHAHAASCLADNGIDKPVIAVVLDGAGLGSDGAIWGGEFLVVSESGFTRRGHLMYTPLPGGDRAAREPWRMAASHLVRASVSTEDIGKLPCLAANREKWPALIEMMRTGVNSPETSSMGRLFDALASIAGLRHVARHEGQAASELEQCADAAERGAYPVSVHDEAGMWIVDTRPLIGDVVSDVLAGRACGTVSMRFHNWVAEAVLTMVERISDETGLRLIALTGGVFQNALLEALTSEKLAARGFGILRHRTVPCNDGGLALGQAVVAASRMKAGEVLCA
ncbi:MAG: carbamoyltransferase HypF [Gemmatimonadota bacterium]